MARNRRKVDGMTRTQSNQQTCCPGITENPLIKLTELQPGGGTACVDVCKREKPCCGQLRGGCMFAKKKSTE
eukprot:544895-Pelagomonas_calceolata.AAC.9